MKIITTRKRGKRIYFKFLLITFCVKIVNKYNTKYKKYYFGGIIRTYRQFNPLAYTMKHDFYFLEKKYFTLMEQDDYRFYYFKKFLYRKLNLKNIIKKLYFNVIKNYDNVFILNANSGETYLFLMYAFDAMCKKYNLVRPVFIATKAYHEDLIKTICPEVPYIKIKKFYQNITGNTFNIDGINFIKIFAHEHFIGVEHDIQANPEAHYFNSILQTLGIKDDEVTTRNIQISQDIENRMLEKVKKTNLNMSNFVFISPEASSCEFVDTDIWVNIIKKCNQHGTDVFINSPIQHYTFKNIQDIEYKTCKLSFAETFALAKYAKKIYSLRSGLTEYLLQTNIPMEVYYTPFRNNHITAEQIHTGFTLTKLPNVNTNNIKEFVL